MKTRILRLAGHLRRSFAIQPAYRLIQQAWVYSLYWSGALRWAKSSLRDSGAIVVLTFHRVLKDSAFDNSSVIPGVAVRERTFRELAGHVAKYYEPVRIGDTVPRSSSGRLRIAFTFDDGWTDNYAVALPITERFGIPMTVFICPGLIDSNKPFWPERMTSLSSRRSGSFHRREVEELIETLKTYGPEEREDAISKLLESNGVPVTDSSDKRWTLSWEEVLEMDKLGVTFGSHTQTHQILTTLPASRIQAEIRLSKAAIEHALGTPCRAFAYPNGNWDPEIRAAVEQEGFQVAFTTERGAWMPQADPLSIPRANVYEGNVVLADGRFSTAMFEYTTFWKVWLATKKRTRRKAAKPSSAPVDSAAAQPACQD